MLAVLLTLAAAAGPAPDAAALLHEAKRLYAAQEYDAVVPVTKRLLDSKVATVEHRLDAYLLQGKCFAIIGRITESEVAFRRMLRGRPDIVLDERTSPKILSVFRRVEAEERAIREEVQRLERERAISEMQIIGDEPTNATGSQPIPFRFRIRDPRGLVTNVVVHYRRAGAGAFSSLPLVREEDGTFGGSILGEWTTDENRFVTEWYLASSDANGASLIGIAGEQTPRQLEVAAGVPPAFYQTGWFWGVAAGVAVIAGGVTTALVVTAPDYPDSELGVVRLP